MTARDYMQRAIELAQKGEGHTRPNPPVGAVLVKASRIIGEGYHKRAGSPHAEVAAIANARRKHEDPRGAALYVTLEPCSTPGLVGACTDAIVEAGIKAVVYGARDPNPKNAGRSEKVLSAAGIACNLFADTAFFDQKGGNELIKPFAKFITKSVPYVTVKIAMSLDGRICDNKGNSRWISSEDAREATGELREKADVILVGAETVRKDNPTLLAHGTANPDLVRAVVTRSGKLPKKATVFTDGKNETLVYKVPDGNLAPMMEDLAKRGYMHVLCEGGLQLATSLAEQGFVDRWISVIAPKVIGTRPLAKAAVVPEVVLMEDVL